MANILDEIVEKTRQRVNEYKKQKGLKEIVEEVQKIKYSKDLIFVNALKSESLSFICEVKKASPSKGVICQDFDPIAIAKSYKDANATCLSVLTEPFFFKGCDNYIKNIKDVVDIPILRKDFIVDEYMIYQSKLIGADAILLIVAILTKEELRNYIDLAENLALSYIVEVHTKEELEIALEVGANVIGINNRDLKSFEVSLETSVKLKNFIKNEDILVISESGIATQEDIKYLKSCGISSFLIGESFMRDTTKIKSLMSSFSR